MPDKQNVINATFGPSNGVADTISEVAEVLLRHADRLKDAQADVHIQYELALNIIEQCKGHVVICGMGKSGHIGNKLAATLASTGTPAFFVHPAEAFHGDLGMITPNSVVLLISNSGTTAEILNLIPSLKRFGNKIIAMTGNPLSPLAKYADAVVDIFVEKEVCPHNLAPTTSTTLTTVVGDALAVELMNRRSFCSVDFAMFHPGGALGRLLLTPVSKEMKSTIPFIAASSDWNVITTAMKDGGFGAAIVVNGEGHLEGVITDGDIRRAVSDPDFHRHTSTAKEIMTTGGLCIEETASMYEAEQLMRQNRIKMLVVIDAECRVVGVVDFGA